MPLLRYALYARKSHDDTDVTEKSLQDQLKIWRALAAERGYAVEREYQESKTAKEAGIRPHFDDMIRRIKRGEINAILVWHVNRLARNMTEGGLLADLLIEGKIQEIRTPSEVFRQQDNILPLVLQQATATQNNRDHAAAVTRGVRSRFEDGGWTHRAPIGYLNRRDVNNPRKGVLIKDPERFDLLRRGWEKLLTGAYSVEDVVDIMNSEWGLRTRQTNKRGGVPLTRSHGYKLFSCVFYAGYVFREGNIQKGVHPPMVTLKEFHRAQEIIRSRRKARKSRKGLFTFTGIIRCARCGQAATAGIHRKNGKEHIYYRCSDSFRKCTKRGISQERIENMVVELLDSITVDSELCKIALDNILRSLGEASGKSESTYSELHRALENVERQLNNLVDLRIREVISDDGLYREKEMELVRERTRLKLAVDEAEQELETARTAAKNGYNFLAFARDYYLLADIETKKELARALGIEFHLDANELSITLNPLLGEMVAFTDQIMVTFEPGIEGSQSRYRASFTCKKSFGRTVGTLFEPGATLQRLLKSHHFPRFEWPARATASTAQATPLAA